MNINISVLSNTIQQATAKSGKPYSFCEIAYKDNGLGKVAAKKIMSFDPLYKVAADAAAGQVFDIDMQKEGEYWQWKSMVRNLNGATTPTTTATSTAQTGSAKPLGISTYATAEERAKTQVYIIRQNALTNAVNLLTTGAKNPPPTETILDQAALFAGWVLDMAPPAQAQSLAEMSDDVPV